jgi:hypothetical protein
MFAGDLFATRGQEADDDQGYGDQGKDDPREHAASVPCYPCCAWRTFSTGELHPRSNTGSAEDLSSWLARWMMSGGGDV